MRWLSVTLPTFSVDVFEVYVTMHHDKFLIIK